MLEGDVQGSLDADRLASLHVPVVQLNTDGGFGGECHLDANMVRSALPALPLDELDLLIVENVGNLVCPAEFRIGEDARIMVSSVAEGEDKPLKYPLMFRACELVLVNKIDLLPHVDFDLGHFMHHLDAVHPGVARMVMSARTGEGLDAFRDWLVGAAGRAVVSRVRDVPRDADASPRRRSSAGWRRPRPFFERRGGADRAAVPPDGRALRARRAADRRSARSPAARSDVRHVAVEFVHPVIVGKRALPAIGSGRRAARSARQLALLAEPDDIVIAFGDETRARGARARAGERGCLTIGFGRGGASGSSRRPATTRSCARSWSRRSTTCCGSSCTCSSTIAGCWRAARRGRSTTPARRASSTRSSASSETDLEAVVADVRESVLMKAAEVGELRAQTLAENRDALAAAAAALRACFDAGGRLLAFGNGGSATDAMDAVADLPRGAAGLARPRRRSTSPRTPRS